GASNTVRVLSWLARQAPGAFLLPATKIRHVLPFGKLSQNSENPSTSKINVDYTGIYHVLHLSYIVSDHAETRGDDVRRNAGALGKHGKHRARVIPDETLARSEHGYVRNVLPGVLGEPA